MAGDIVCTWKVQEDQLKNHYKQQVYLVRKLDIQNEYRKISSIPMYNTNNQLETISERKKNLFTIAKETVGVNITRNMQKLYEEVVKCY